MLIVTDRRQPKPKNMIRQILTFALFSLMTSAVSAQTPSKVDYDAFEKLVAEVKPHRAARLVNVERFGSLSKQKDVIILDTRSKAMYDAKHVKGAIHLNFSDFTQKALENLIPSKDTKILIYCNNNFDEDEEYFPTKSFTPPTPNPNRLTELTLALNIPTYINLYGYGFRNVYELSELISIHDVRIQLEGTAVPEGF